MSATVATLREALAGALALGPFDDTGGNVRIARGAFQAHPVLAAFIDNRAASGAIGVADAQRLIGALHVARHERTRLALFIDSAGARVSEGLPALGAFRALYRAGLHAVLDGVPIAAVLGRNCYGGSSMLAHLAVRRLFAPDTRLAMSGPGVIAAASGIDASDPAFRAAAEATMCASARAQASADNTVWSPGVSLEHFLHEAFAAHDAPRLFRARHGELRQRLGPSVAVPAAQAARRSDLDRLYPRGYQAQDADGLLTGEGDREDGAQPFVGLVGPTPLAAQRAWRFADAVWRHAERPPARLEVLLDCANHAPSLEEERRILTQYIVDMSVALGVLAARGTRVGLTVLGKAGGGVYVALAAPAERVASIPGADIQVLPGAAVAAILGSSRASAPDFTAFRAAGVAESEIELGRSS